MVSNDLKIDNNCIVSFKRAKTDVYGLIDANKKQTEMISELKADKNKIILRVNELQQILNNMSSLIKESSDRVTQVWEYAESIKATTTRLTTTIKKLRIDQEKLSRNVNINNNVVVRKIKSLNVRIYKKTAQINDLKEAQKKLSTSVKSVKTVKTVKVAKTVKKSPAKKVSKPKKRKSNNFGSLKPNLELVEGIGPKYAEKIKKAGIMTTKQLLIEGATVKGREDVAKRVKVSKARVLEWVNRIDLMRINGIGEEYSDLLEQAGVDTVPELAIRNYENLTDKMVEINDKKKLVRVTPSKSKVKIWVRRANKMPRILEY